MNGNRLLVSAIAAVLGLAAAPAVASALVVNQVGGQDDRWPATRAGNLTYCVSTSFGQNRARVATAVRDGSLLWENASSVNFVHRTGQDATCTVNNPNVVFVVRPKITTEFVTASFYPHWPKSTRKLLVNVQATFSGDLPAADLLGNALGHTLGFRNEQTRPEAPDVCFEDWSWRALTPYDPSSIMHSPSCGVEPPYLTFSDYDAMGVALLYGS